MNTMEQSPGHVIPKSTLFATYIGLVVLSLIMIGLSRIQVDRIAIHWMDLHAIKAVVIMGIALVMGIIVAMFLMGLRYEVKLLNLTIFLTNFVFLLIFVAFTWADTSFRAEIDPSFAQEINFTSPVKAEATTDSPQQHGSKSSMQGAGGEPTGQGNPPSSSGAAPAGAPTAGSDTGASRGNQTSDTSKHSPPGAPAPAPAKPAK